jgi:hypothetical protein
VFTKEDAALLLTTCLCFALLLEWYQVWWIVRQRSKFVRSIDVVSPAHADEVARIHVRVLKRLARSTMLSAFWIAVLLVVWHIAQ